MKSNVIPVEIPTKWSAIAGACFIAFLALCSYWPSLTGGFIWDDDLLLTRNPLIEASDGLYRIWLTTQAVDYWPVTNSSFWLEWRLWGMNPTGYHVTNVLLHIASAMLLWSILRRLAIPGALLAALIFLFHPVNVESVAWIAQRKNTLSMVFFLISIRWYLIDELRKPRLRKPSIWYWLSLLAFITAILAKGSVVILPLILLLAVWWLRRAVTFADLLKTCPFFLVAGVLTLVNIWFQSHGTDSVIRHATFLERTLGAGAVVWWSLYKAILPVSLSFIYPKWSINAGDFRWWIPALMVVAVSVFLLWHREKTWGRALLFAWAYYCVSLLPVMGFVDVYFMKFSLVADHYQYIAMISIAAVVAAAMEKLLPRRLRWWCGGILVATLGLMTWQQSGMYKDSGTVWATTLSLNPNSAMANYNLGLILLEEDRIDESQSYLRTAIQLDPANADAHNNLGLILLRQNRTNEAIEHFEKAMEIRPRSSGIHGNLGTTYTIVGRNRDAVVQFEAALKLSPADANLANNFAWLLATCPDSTVRNGPKALELAQRAVQLTGGKHAGSIETLAAAYAESGNFEKALEAGQNAVSLATATNNNRLDFYKSLLKFYEAGRPYHGE